MRIGCESEIPGERGCRVLLGELLGGEQTHGTYRYPMFVKNDLFEVVVSSG